MCESFRACTMQTQAAISFIIGVKAHSRGLSRVETGSSAGEVGQ